MNENSEEGIIRKLGNLYEESDIQTINGKTVLVVKDGE